MLVEFLDMCRFSIVFIFLDTSTSRIHPSSSFFSYSYFVAGVLIAILVSVVVN